MKPHMPYLFDEFLSSGLEESISPFLQKTSRAWAKNLHLKSSFLSALLLFFAFLTSFFSPDLSHLFLLPVYFLSGTPAILHTIDDIKNFEINIDVLMTIAALLSFIIGSQMEGALLLVLFTFSGALERTVSKKAGMTLLDLKNLAPAVATVVGKADTFFERSIHDIDIGTHLLVKAGEIIPLDGVITEGYSFVNLAHLTGESVPIPKKIGDEVQAGSRNLDGTLTIEVTKTSSHSTLTRITQLLQEAQERKPKIQCFFDRFSKWYAAAILSLFILLSISIPLFFSIPFFGTTGSIYRALTFLIAASPCALIIGTPTAYLSAISACARKGILLKGGISLDALDQTKTIAFDKTGTLTTGKLTCTKAEKINEKHDCTLSEAISIAYALEQHTTHPMANAICRYAKGKKIAPFHIEAFQSLPGCGLKGIATIGDQKKEVAIGSKSFTNAAQEKFQMEGMISFLRVGETFFLFHFLDQLRPHIQELLTHLKEDHHLNLVMLTGDHEKSAKAIADQVGISTFYAELTPKQKLDIISKLDGLAMVGDGMNDAPALARATVGLSMGKIGSATAVDASDIVFLRDDLSLIDWLYAKAHKTVQIVRENLFLALGIICFASLSALIGFLPLWAAVILHEGGTLLVGLNGLRLLQSKPLVP
jgi:Cd2+/Zn2+-exporting ATPase